MVDMNIEIEIITEGEDTIKLINNGHYSALEGDTFHIPLKDSDINQLIKALRIVGGV